MKLTWQKPAVGCACKKGWRAWGRLRTAFMAAEPLLWMRTASLYTCPMKQHCTTPHTTSGPHRVQTAIGESHGKHRRLASIREVVQKWTRLELCEAAGGLERDMFSRFWQLVSGNRGKTQNRMPEGQEIMQRMEMALCRSTEHHEAENTEAHAKSGDMP